jgi:hypothetical protein
MLTFHFNRSKKSFSRLIADVLNLRLNYATSALQNMGPFYFTNRVIKISCAGPGKVYCKDFPGYHW